MATATETKTKKPTLAPALKLSSQDNKCIRSFKRQCDILKIRTKQVATRAQNGLIVFGPPGIGKTKAILHSHGDG